MTEEIISPELIMDMLGTRMIGRHVLYFPSVTSTNEIAKKEAGKGVEEGTVVIADEQTAGRGRLKRSWLTPEGNIALSVILYPQKPVLPSLIIIASLAVSHSIEAVTGLETQIKWPNDVLIGGRKVCGILVESDVRNEKVNYAVIGIGINVNAGKDVLSRVVTPATSLYIETGYKVSRIQIIRALLKSTDKVDHVEVLGAWTGPSGNFLRIRSTLTWPLCIPEYGRANAIVTTIINSIVS